jgi:hypothetical protein
MYALHPYSGSMLAKQCQRLHADGRKRGDKLANLVGDLLALGEHDNDCTNDGINGDMRWMTVLLSTLELHDRSLWHPIGSDNISLFPKSGIKALGLWCAHLVYIEGGNTFWLPYCMRVLGDACVFKTTQQPTFVTTDSPMTNIDNNVSVFM